MVQRGGVITSNCAFKNTPVTLCVNYTLTEKKKNERKTHT